MSKTVVVDQELCIGCGTCEALCPQVFYLSDAGKAEIVPNYQENLPCIQEVVESCPVQAVSLK